MTTFQIKINNLIELSYLSRAYLERELKLNIDTRIKTVPVNNITSLSIPIPIPPVGGNPYSNAST